LQKRSCWREQDPVLLLVRSYFVCRALAWETTHNFYSRYCEQDLVVVVILPIALSLLWKEDLVDKNWNFFLFLFDCILFVAQLRDRHSQF
jgi:hypothetical protein